MLKIGFSFIPGFMIKNLFIFLGLVFLISCTDSLDAQDDERKMAGSENSEEFVEGESMDDESEESESDSGEEYDDYEEMDDGFEEGETDSSEEYNDYEEMDDGGEELDYESDDQSEKKDEIVFKPTDATSEKLIDLYLKALGGIDRLKAITTLKMEGEFREGEKNWNMTWFRKAPNKYREERHHRLLGRDYITVKAYNGSKAWVREVSPEMLLPEEMSKGEITSFIQEAEFYNHLIDWREKGHRFNYVDKIKVLKKPTYFVQGKLKDNRDVFYYFDTQSFLLRQFGFKERFAGSLIDADYIPVKLKKVNGVWMEEKKQYLVEGRVYKEITYNKILANIDIPDSLFEIPVVKEFILRQKDR